jgi:hypothetical protein
VVEPHRRAAPRRLWLQVSSACFES